MISADLTDKNTIIIFPFQSTQMIVVGLKTELSQLCSVWLKRVLVSSAAVQGHPGVVK